MKKVYSQKASTEVFALAPEQLAVFKSAGYETPTAEEAIADAGAVKLAPPEGKRAYVAFDFKAGEFFVRVKTCTLRGSEYSNLIKELTRRRYGIARIKPRPNIKRGSPQRERLSK